MTDNTTTPAVHAAVSQVMREIGKYGIAKDRKTSQGPASFSFRSIDDIYNRLNPLMVEAGLVVYPRLLEWQQVERTSSRGNALFYTTVKVEYTFVAVADGSERSVIAPGEAMDSADKSTNKAMSAALKYACFQLFMIPTEGDNDADASHHDVAPPPAKKKPAMTAEQKAAGLIAKINKFADTAALNAWWNDEKTRKFVAKLCDEDKALGDKVAAALLAKRGDAGDPFAGDDDIPY